MALNIRKQPGESVPTPSTFHVQLYIDVDGSPKVKDSTGAVTDLTSSATGVAGGDLSGVFPNPSVVSAPALKTLGAPVDVSSSPAPTAGQILVATTGTTAMWQDVPGSSPVGAAGGDLSGVFPSPSVVRALGLRNSSTTVSTGAASAPAVGQILTATSSSTASWQDPPDSTPSGPASGDLTGNFPNPLVVTSSALRTSTSNVSTAAAAAPSSGQALVATGSTTATWQSPSGDLSGTWSAPTVVQARGLKSATTTVSVSSATAPSIGQVLTATSSVAATWQTPTAYVRNSVWDPPASGNSADEEFTSDPFLGVAWIVKDSNGVTQTRAGNVSPVDYPSAGTFRSTQAGSTVYFQVHRDPSLTYYLYKAVTSPISTEQIWTCGMGTVRNMDTAASSFGAEYAMFISASSAGAPDLNNMVEIGVKNLSPPGVSCDFYSNVVAAGTPTSGITFSDISMIVSGFPGFVVRKGDNAYGGVSGVAASTSNSLTFGMFSPYGSMAAGHPIGGDLPNSFSGTWAWAGFKIKPDDNSNSGEQAWAQIFAMHFLRRKTGPTAYLFG